MLDLMKLLGGFLVGCKRELNGTFPDAAGIMRLDG
jgi:hypothetical protein